MTQAGSDGLSSADNPQDLQPDTTTQRFSWESVSVVALLLILLIAGALRFGGLNWDSGQHLHPDERFLTDVTARLSSTTNPLTYLNSAESPLNPYNLGERFFVYGNFPVTMTRFAAEGVQAMCELVSCSADFTSYDGIHLVGRALSGVLDLVTIGFLFLLGRRLYDWRVGLLAALLMALAVLPIQSSHFFTVDNWATALTTISLYAAVRASQRAKWYWWVLFGIALGLTVASRINLAPLALVAAVAAFIWLSRSVHTWDELRSPHGLKRFLKAMMFVLLAAVTAMITFRLAMPYAFGSSSAALWELLSAETPAIIRTIQRSIDLNPQWLANLAEISAQQKPTSTLPHGQQWIGRTPLVYPLTQMALYGMGLTAAIAACLGFFWAAWRTIMGKRNWRVHLIPVAWIAIYFLFMGTRWVLTMRYFLPIYPALFLLASWALIALWRQAGENQTRRILAGIAIAVVVIPSLLWSFVFTEVYRQPVTRLAASEWLLDNISSGATLLYALDGTPHELQLPLKATRFEPGSTVSLPFTLPENGVVTGVRLNRLTAVSADNPATLSLTLFDAAGQPQGSTLAHIEAIEPRSAHVAAFDNVGLTGATPHSIQITLAEGGPLSAETSVILTEQWDDALPLRLPDRDGYAAYFDSIRDLQLGFEGSIPITFADSAEKQAGLVRWLNSADVIAISSSRNLWALPRNPLTYPLTIAYYDALFNGELGFDLVQQFNADLNIGPLHIDDTRGTLTWGDQPTAGWPPPGALAAEEAFSVYDHPPVWIFAKRDDFDLKQVAATLDAVDVTDVVNLNPAQAAGAPTGLALSDTAFAAQREGGTFRERFALDSVLNRYPALAAGVWWLLTAVLGWLAFPIIFVVLRGLPTRGYALARILALLLISYGAWLLGSAGWVDFGRNSLLLTLSVMTLSSVIIAIRQRHALQSYLKKNYRYVILVELLALALFLLGIIIRLGNPDVWDVIWGGEKPMDLSYFNAVLKSTTFPPYNPWLSGSYINYYYYGYVFVAVPTLLLGIVPTTAYNLIIPMLFAFTGIGAFAVAFNLVASRRLRRRSSPDEIRSVLHRSAVGAGLVAITLSILLGNLAQLKVIFSSWQRAGDTSLSGIPQAVDGLFKQLSGMPSPLYPGDWFFTATRALNFVEGEAVPITEFPFFTFLYADLHAHMISLPLTMLALAWAISWALWPVQRMAEGDRFGRILRYALIFLVGGIAIGVLYPTNSWDWPTYLVIGFLGILLHNFRRFGGLNRPMVGRSTVQIAILAVFSYVTFLPFWQTFGSGYTTLKPWDGSRSDLISFLSIYGLFLLLIITHLAREMRSWTASWSVERLERMEKWVTPMILGLIGYIALMVLFVWAGYPIAPLVITIILVAGLLSLRTNLGPERRIVLGLIAAAFFFTLFVEVAVLDGDISRMNTVFKFYMQVWLLLSVVGAVALVWLWRALSAEWGQTRRRVWLGTFGVLLFLALLYPVLATRAKWEIRMSDQAPTTLDGMVFMETTSYSDNNQTVALAPEYEALRWMQRHIDGSPVVMEAHGKNPYRSIASRVAMYTGLPTVVGWDWHQRQQRAILPDAGVWSRIADVDNFYNTTDSAEAQRILDKYDVDYVYAGSLENVYYTAEGVAKLDAMAADGTLKLIYDENGVKIYQVGRMKAEG